ADSIEHVRVASMGKYIAVEILRSAVFFREFVVINEVFPIVVIHAWAGCGIGAEGCMHDRLDEHAGQGGMPRIERGGIDDFLGAQNYALGCLCYDVLHVASAEAQCVPVDISLGHVDEADIWLQW